MEDWKRKLVDAVRPYVHREDLIGRARHEELRDWLIDRDLNKIIDIKSAQHAIELMELIDCWHDEDAANKPCAAPPEPSNPFIVEKVKRKLALGWTGDLRLMLENRTSVFIAMNYIRYTPSQLRALAKQLTDLADAHEAVYPPKRDTDACAKAC